MPNLVRLAADASPRKYPRRWGDGAGLVRLDSRGREVFVLERRIGQGRRVKITLGVSSEREALAELALFDRDPDAYRTRAQARQAPGFRLDADTLAAFQTERQRDVKEGRLTAHYVLYTLRSYLGAWAKAINGRPLRDLTLADLRGHLDSWPSAHAKRIVALKSFTAWARRVGKLARKDDPTLDLEVPPVTVRPVAGRAYSAETVSAFYAALRDYDFAPGFGPDAPPGAARVLVSLQSVRDVFILRMLHGMHHSEIDRLARGTGQIRALEGEGELAATIIFPHKRGDEHVITVGAQALAAARRLQFVGKAPDRNTIMHAVRRVAAEHPNLAGFTFERLRHTFVTLGAGGRVVTARAGGVPVELLGQVAGHRSTATTRRHYLGAHIPPLVILPVDLRNVDDPS